MTGESSRAKDAKRDRIRVFTAAQDRERDAGDVREH